MAFHERFPDHEAVKTLTSDLLSGATFSSNGVYWDEPEVDWWNWGTNTRTTALALTALIRVTPQSDLLPNVVCWLMAARQGDHWPTTQETVWSITALTEWMTLTGELQGNYRYDVNFDGKSLASATISPTANPGQTLHIDVANLQKGALNKLSISRGEGAGVLYYTAQFNMQIPAAGAKAVSNGISIQREYFLGSDTSWPIHSAQVADLCTVRLTITTAQDLQYFALEDMYPAGAEPVDPNLLTTTIQANGPSISEITHDVHTGIGAGGILITPNCATKKQTFTPAICHAARTSILTRSARRHREPSR